MTIDDVMLRGMMDAEKDRRNQDREDAIRYMRRWRKVRKVIEAAVVVLTLAMLALLVWCSVSETPHRLAKEFSGQSVGRANER